MAIRGFEHTVPGALEQPSRDGAHARLVVYQQYRASDRRR